MKTNSDEDFLFSMSAPSQQVHLPFDMAVEHVSTPFFLSLAPPLFCVCFYFFINIFSSLSAQQILFSLWLFFLRLCMWRAFLFLSPLTHRQIESVPYIFFSVLLQMSTQLTHYLDVVATTGTSNARVNNETKPGSHDDAKYAISMFAFDWPIYNEIRKFPTKTIHCYQRLLCSRSWRSCLIKCAAAAGFQIQIFKWTHS